MKPLIAALAATALAFASGAEPKVPRAKVVNVEKLISTALASMYPDEPYFLIGPARGVYIEGVGVVYITDINLATGPTMSPFSPPVNKEQMQRHRDKKEVRLPLLKNKILEISGSVISLLDALPANEDFILTINLLRYPWEDPAGLPSQLILRVQKGKLGKAVADHARIDTIAKVQEY